MQAMGRRGRVLLALVLIAAATVPWARAASADVPGTIPAAELVQRLKAGRSVDEHDLTVTGAFDLRSVGTVSEPVRCLDCVFTGPFVAPDVLFQRIVVLSGSRFEGSIDLRGAVFQDGLFVRTSRHASTFEAFALFSLATVSDVAAFDGAVFRDEANFTGARFLGDASFVDTVFETNARFTQASFSGSAAFFSTPSAAARAPAPGPCPTPVQGTVGRVALFPRAVFAGPADFRLRCFEHGADFRSAAFHSRASFTQTQFVGLAAFDDASMDGDAVFASSRFQTGGSFVRLSASRSVDFEGAAFRTADLSGMTVGGQLSLSGASLRRPIRMHRVLASELAMAPSNVARVEGAADQEHVLSMIESTAKSGGDLTTANRRSSGFGHWFDTVVYRGVAGYLVSPIHPLVAFLVLLLALGVARAVARLRRRRRTRRRAPAPAGQSGSSAARSRGRARKAPLGVVQWASALFEGIGDTAAAAFRRKPDATIEDRERVGPYLVAGARWAESLAFKVLIALFLICLASSNATLRQLVDSVTH
jgi:uncharacterized protein YjbI with pentapeptide repeats